MNLTSTPLLQWCAAIIFGIALVHVFSTKLFEHLAHTQPRHAGFWHLLGEIEVVFGFWAAVLMVLMFFISGQSSTIRYLESRDFTEPLFVFAIMVIAGTKPVLDCAAALVQALARRLPLPGGIAHYFLVMAFVPLLGSLITEPAAMTLAALMLRQTLFSQPVSVRLKYLSLGVLFVNISIGGTLTHFAAPPVIMVASQWGWDMAYMFTTFGWKAALAVFVNAAAITLIYRKDLQSLNTNQIGTPSTTPVGVVLVHLLFLLGVVVFAHYPVIFLALLLFFLGFVSAYPQYQSSLILREALLVAFFLAGLVVLGGQQQWWLQPMLLSMDANAVFYGATALTAITDNAALTYLGSLVEGLSEEFKIALVAGAVTGGGLTIIANAPNPAGAAILKQHFSDGAIHPLGLLLAATPPTMVAIAAFRWL